MKELTPEIQFSKERHPVYSGKNALESLLDYLDRQKFSSVGVLVDENTLKFCYPLISKSLPTHHLIVVPAGENHKNLQTCTTVWEKMVDLKMDRSSVLINLGGGMICDLGGFAATTFKRGMTFVHVPTTILAMVDAAIGGKTGVDFMHFKNLVGSFSNPGGVFTECVFLESLSRQEQLSGFGEMIKHALIDGGKEWEKLRALPDLPTEWEAFIRTSAHVKMKIVLEDPQEKGVRKLLNLGHTLGHALERHFLHYPSHKPVIHGHAVAAGILCESHISLQRGWMTQKDFNSIESFINKYFTTIPLPAEELELVYENCLQDKKNQGHNINCSLLTAPGVAKIDQVVTHGEILTALRHYQTRDSRSAVL